MKLLRFLAALLLVTVPVQSFALDKRVRVFLISSAAGAVIGTGVGLVIWPFSGDAKSIFLGTSVGLYLGLAVGAYFLIFRNDPGNPINQVQGLPYEKGALSLQADLWRYEPHFQVTPSAVTNPALFQFEVPILRF